MYLTHDFKQKNDGGISNANRSLYTQKPLHKRIKYQPQWKLSRRHARDPVPLPRNFKLMRSRAPVVSSATKAKTAVRLN